MLDTTRALTHSGQNPERPPHQTLGQPCANPSLTSHGVRPRQPPKCTRDCVAATTFRARRRGWPRGAPQDVGLPRSPSCSSLLHACETSTWTSLRETSSTSEELTADATPEDEDRRAIDEVVRGMRAGAASSIGPHAPHEQLVVVAAGRQLLPVPRPLEAADLQLHGTCVKARGWNAAASRPSLRFRFPSLHPSHSAASWGATLLARLVDIAWSRKRLR